MKVSEGISLCGVRFESACDVVSVLSLKGGGENNFYRQAMAATLNCMEWGCPSEVRDAISAGCAGDYSTASALDSYNNGLIWGGLHGAEQPAGHGSANPRYCR